ncbi:MAG: hypothetical protein M1286_00205 [Candidatus Marsarchaeota archaeon]|nr:hypothetical protein [Candidatus Marsarchaeota archaeon]
MEDVDIFSQSKESAKKRDEYRFFFYGLVITVFVSFIVQLLLLPVKVTGLDYYYNSTLIFSTFISNIFFMLLAIFFVFLFLYFVVYKFIVPRLMATTYQSKMNIGIPSEIKGEEKIRLHKELKEIFENIGQMKGFEVDTEEKTWELTKGIFSNPKIKVEWEDRQNIVVLSWINDIKVVDICQDMSKVFIEKIETSFKKGLPQ